MPSNAEVEIYRAFRVAQDKYRYFQLTAAGAAIALAVNQTQGGIISWSQLPLAFGVLAWGLSFFFGCRHLNYVGSTLYANAELLRIESGRHPNVGAHPQYVEAASQGIRQAIESNSERASRFARRQFHLLVAGAVFYVMWHVLEMYLRSPI